MTVPLIYTTKGNVPLDSLTVDYKWEFHPNLIVFREIYYLDGEMVKEAGHQCKLDGLVITKAPGQIG